MRNFLAVIVLLLAAACGQPTAQKFQLTDVTGASFGKSLALTDHNGKPRTLADFKGKVVVIFFGFTQCPDVCPTTLSEMGKVLKELGADGDQVQVLFVSVDPERDTAELLRQYTTAFHPSFLGLRGDMDATRAAAKEFKVIFQKVQLKTGGYSVDHSAGMFILDQQGQLRLFAQHGASGQALLADIRTLIKQPAPAKSG
jgi:protein SCO1/2